MELPVRYEVSVSETFKALWRGRDTAAPTQTVPPVAEAAVAEPAIVRPRRRPKGFRPLRLRREGARPLRFEGVELCHIEAGRHAMDGAEDAAADGDGYQRCTLYLTTQRACFAHLVVLPPAALAARPVYRASHVQDRADLLALLAEARPETILLAPAPSGTAPAYLRDAFDRLVAQSDQLVGATTHLVLDAA